MTSNGDSPARSIKNVLSLKRQSRDDVSSTNSGSKSPRRNSNDSAMAGKLKSLITKSGNDDDESSDGKRSAKDLLGFIKLKEKIRRKSQAVDSQDENRGRDAEPKQTISGVYHSERSSILNDGDGSLLGSDHETEM